MGDAGFQLTALRDPRIAQLAVSTNPVWLWSIDGTRILWCNAAGAAALQLREPPSRARPLQLADPRARQVIQLAGRLPPSNPTRLERLRGFGMPLGGLLTCACTRFEVGGQTAILMVAMDRVGRSPALAARLQFLIDEIDEPAAAFLDDGHLAARNAATKDMPGLSGLGAKIHAGEIATDRIQADVTAVGHGHEIAFVALLSAAPAQQAEQVATELPVASPDVTPPTITPTPFVPVAANVATPVRSDESILERIAPAETPKPHVTPLPPADIIAQPRRDETGPASIEDVLRTVSEAPDSNPPVDDDIADRAVNAATLSIDDIAEIAPVVTEDDNPIAEQEDAPTDETLALSADGVAEDRTTEEPASGAPAPANTNDDTLFSLDELDEWPTNRRHPLRFTWQMNADYRFTLGGDEFTRMMGAQTSAAFGRPWSEIARLFDLDPEGRVAKALETRETWSGILVQWPFDGFNTRLPIELSALPLFDRSRNFLGYRGFGVCHDLAGLERIALARRQEGLFGETVTPRFGAPTVQTPETDVTSASASNDAGDAHTTVTPIRHEPEATELPRNILQFRQPGDMKTPTLSQVENNAFDEIARRLSQGLGTQDPLPDDEPMPFEPFAGHEDQTADEIADHAANDAPSVTEAPIVHDGVTSDEPMIESPSFIADQTEPRETASWLTPAATPPRGDAANDRALLDLMQAGILIYRMDQMLYANRPFLKCVGFDDLIALQTAGGLDALYIELLSTSSSSSSAEGMPLTVAPARDDAEPVEGRLFSIMWSGERALALILSPEKNASSAPVSAQAAPAPAPTPPEPPPAPAQQPDNAIQAAATVTGAPPKESGDNADLNALFETASDAIVLFDHSGAITACNRRAEALFRYSSKEFLSHNLSDLFAFESQRIVLDYFESLESARNAGGADHGRELVGCTSDGRFIPLSMTMGRNESDADRFFAVFRDLSQLKQSEAELLQARKRAERATSAKADVLAKLSHDVRAPLNTIIGFANMMIEERFGALGNARYQDYLKDIRASGERVLAIIGDMFDLSRVETGRLDLTFARQNLNEVVEQCVALAQPQANRERIIIRTSLTHSLPAVTADLTTLKQITTNLIASSIRLSKAGGQVIVSTAQDEGNGAVLRVRDTGRGLSEAEIANAMDPYHAPSPDDTATSDESGIDLSLTKALTEANRARFLIKSTPQGGTLIEVTFPSAR